MTQSDAVTRQKREEDQIKKQNYKKKKIIIIIILIEKHYLLINIKDYENIKRIGHDDMEMFLRS